MYEDIKNEIRASGYTGELQSYNYTELLAILEFGDPRAFAQLEYDYSDGYNCNYNLGSADKYIRGSRERRRISRYRKIMHLLEYLPENFQTVVHHIERYDMDRLISATAEYRSNTITRVLIALINERAIENGMSCNPKILAKIFSIDRLNYISSKSLLLDAGIIRRVRKDTVMIQVQNILLEYRDELADRYTTVISISRSFRDKYPDAVRCSDSALLIALLSIRLITGRKSVDIAKSYSDDYRPVYQMMYRAERRDDALRDDLRNADCGLNKL